MRAHLLRLGLIGLACSACSDPIEPSAYNLRILVSTTGVDLDSAFVLRTHDAPPSVVQSSLYLTLAPGPHDLVLEEVAPNCAVLGADSVRVTLWSGHVSEVAFRVECRAVTGVIQVMAPASGLDFDADGYTVYLNEISTTQIFPGGSVLLEHVPPGTHVVRVDGLSANCRLTSAPTQSAEVRAGGLFRDTAWVMFRSSCVATTGNVELSIATFGARPDRNGYTLELDGQVVLQTCGWYDYGCDPGIPLMLGPNSSLVFSQIPFGDHVFRLGDIAPNCTVSRDNPRVVSVAGGEITVVPFDVVCANGP